MNLNEVATLFNVKEKDKSMKNKKKAIEIISKTLTCPRCKKNMRWIEGTNVCVCDSCTITIGKDKDKKTYSVSKILKNYYRRFLENNSKYIADIESKEV